MNLPWDEKSDWEVKRESVQLMVVPWDGKSDYEVKCEIKDECTMHEMEKSILKWIMKE